MYADFEISLTWCRLGVVTYPKNCIFHVKTPKYVARGTLHVHSLLLQVIPLSFQNLEFFRGTQEYLYPIRQYCFPVRCRLGVAIQNIPYFKHDDR